MASKRTKNRAYWVAVKATAYRMQSSGVNWVWVAQELYRQAVHGSPDSHLLLSLENLEQLTGPARLKDVSNSALWEARAIVDAIRKEYQS